MSRKAALAVVCALVAVSGCASKPAPRHDLVAQIYPLQYLLEQLAGPDAPVIGLGATNPHGTPLDAAQQRVIDRAALVVYVGSLAPAVDAAAGGERGVDVASVAQLKSSAAGTDPHFWLDPSRLAAVASLLADRLKKLLPEHALAIRARAETLASSLLSLDRALVTRLAKCDRRAIVTDHAAFGYLAARYQLRQVATAGLSPQESAPPKQLAAVARFIRTYEVTTVFADPRTPSAAIRELATSSRTRLDTLDSLEVAPASGDFMLAMGDNIRRLRTALTCR